MAAILFWFWMVVSLDHVVKKLEVPFPVKKKNNFLGIFPVFLGYLCAPGTRLHLQVPGVAGGKGNVFKWRKKSGQNLDFCAFGFQGVETHLTKQTVEILVRYSDAICFRDLQRPIFWDKVGEIKCGIYYWPLEYQKHLNTNVYEVWISNGLVFNWSMCFFLCTTRHFQRPNQYITKQDVVHLSVFKWSGCQVLKCHSNTGQLSAQYFFDHSNTELIWYSDSHCIAQNPVPNCTTLKSTKPLWTRPFGNWILFYHLNTVQ